MTAYAVCNRLLDAETNEHCEFDGDVNDTPNDFGGFRWTCPGCRGMRSSKYESETDMNQRPVADILTDDEPPLETIPPELE